MNGLAVVDWSWLQEHAHAFFIGKGLLALVATVLVVVHMSTTWALVTSWAQRLRYLSLLALIGTVTYASPEQAAEGIGVAPRHVFAALSAVLVCVAMVVSIRADLRRRR